MTLVSMALSKKPDSMMVDSAPKTSRQQEQPSP
jgi:hypothetical protein